MIFTKSALVILNPKAGKCKGAKKLSDIISVLQGGDYSSTVILTTQVGDAMRFAASCADKHDLIVCIGGDGTFSEVVSGMIASGHHTPIGYIPAGSANDYGTSLGLSADPCIAAGDILRGIPQSHDIGTFNGLPFAYVAAFGAFAKASYSTAQDLKNVLGHLAYVLKGIQDLHTLRPEHLIIDVDEERIEGDYILGMISNAFSIGGILRYNPRDVSLNDGYLELLLVSMPENAWEFSDLIQALTSQNYRECKSLLFRRCKKIHIRASADMPWTLDGEYAQGSEDLSIISVPSAIRVIVPAQQE